MNCRRITRPWSAAMLLLAACGGATTHPADEGDAQGHRDQATNERALARQHRAIPARDSAGASPSIDMSRAADHADEVYVAAGRHHGRAALQEQYAREHQAVADSLTDFEAPDCHGLEANTLIICPLLGAVESAEDIDNGIELTLASGVERDGLLDRIQCHISFANSGHGASVHQCPLYLNGVSASAGESPTRILLRTDSPDEVTRLRRGVRQHIIVSVSAPIP